MKALLAADTVNSTTSFDVAEKAEEMGDVERKISGILARGEGYD